MRNLASNSLILSLMCSVHPFPHMYQSVWTLTAPIAITLFPVQIPSLHFSGFEIHIDKSLILSADVLLTPLGHLHPQCDHLPYLRWGPHSLPRPLPQMLSPVPEQSPHTAGALTPHTMPSPRALPRPLLQSDVCLSRGSSDISPGSPSK